MSPQGDSVKFTDEELSGPIRSWMEAAQAAAKRGDSSAALAWYEQSLVNLKPRLIESFAWNRSLGPRDHAETSDEMRALADEIEASAAEALELQVRRLVNLRIKELKKAQEE